MATKENKNAHPPNPQHILQHILPGHQHPPSSPHQRARCLKFSPSLPTIQINNRRNAEEAYYAGEECPLIELPSHWRGWGWGTVREKGTRLFHALLTRSPKLLNVKRHFSICYCRWMRPPDKGYGESEMGVWWWGDVGSEAAFVSWRSMNSGRVPSPFKVDQTFLTASRMND